jgi:hypothetical protein
LNKVGFLAICSGEGSTMHKHDSTHIKTKNLIVMRRTHFSFSISSLINAIPQKNTQMVVSVALKTSQLVAAAYKLGIIIVMK